MVPNFFQIVVVGPRFARVNVGLTLSFFLSPKLDHVPTKARVLCKSFPVKPAIVGPMGPNGTPLLGSRSNFASNPRKDA